MHGGIEMQCENKRVGEQKSGRNILLHKKKDRESLHRGRSSMTNRIYFFLFPSGGLPALSHVWQHTKLSDALSWDPSAKNFGWEFLWRSNTHDYTTAKMVHDSWPCCE